MKNAAIDKLGNLVNRQAALSDKLKASVALQLVISDAFDSGPCSTHVEGNMLSPTIDWSKI